MRNKGNRRLLAGLITVALSITEVLGYLPVYAADPEEYSLENTVVSSWEGGYQGELLLRNLSDREMTEWSINFASANRISDYWGASFCLMDSVDNETPEDYNQEYHYTVEAIDYTGTIAPGEAITIGYIADGTVGESAELSVSYVLADTNTTEDATANTENNGNNVENDDGQQSPEQTSEPAGGIYFGDGYKVEVQIPQTWDHAYNVKLLITNTKEETLHNWGFLMNTADVISGLYNAVEISEHNGTRLLKNAGYNQDIPAGTTVELGYTAFYEESSDVPEGFALASFEKSVEQTDYGVELFVTDVWDDGVVAEIVIENKRDRDIEDWLLEFDCEEYILELWGGVVDEQDNGHYVIRNAVYDHNIPAGKSVAIGIRSGGGTFSVKNPKLREYTVGNAKSEVTDDSGIQYMDTTSGEWTEDIGQVYFKEVYTEEELGLNTEGLRCVRNQLLITAVEGVAFGDIQQIVNNVGARIVGYIELTDDYQIEMNEDTGFGTLEEIRVFFDSLSVVKMAEYNYVTTSNGDSVVDERPALLSNGTRLVWDDESPAGDNWGLEAIRFNGALLAEGVISESFSPEDPMNTDHLSTVRIGAIDDAFNVWHPGLYDNYAKSWYNAENYSEFLGNVDPNTGMLRAHGTHVMGIMSGRYNESKGISGVCVKNRWYGFALNGNSEAKTNATSVFKMKCGLVLLIGNNVKVINCSRGWEDYCFAMSNTLTDEKSVRQKTCAFNYFNNYSKIINELITKMIDKGYSFVIVVSAGNANNNAYYYSTDKERDTGIGFIDVAVYDNEKNHLYAIDNNVTYGAENSNASIMCGTMQAKYSSPLLYSDNEIVCSCVICVGAAGNLQEGSGRGFAISKFSNLGERVDIYAPGENIISTIPTTLGNIDSYGEMSGTSMAAPYVSGAAGFAWSVDPDLKATEVKDVIIKSGENHNGLLLLNLENMIIEVVKRKGGQGIFEEQYYGTAVGEIYTKASDGTNLPLSEVSVSALRVDDNSGTFPDPLERMKDTDQTDIYGTYELVLTPGDYQLMFYKPGFRVRTLDISVKTEEITVCPDMILEEIEAQDIGSISLLIQDLDTKEGIPNTVVNFYVGWDRGNDDLSGTEPFYIGVTDENGRLSVDANIGMYTAEIRRDGYLDGYYNVVSKTTPTSQTIFLKEQQNISDYTIVFVADDNTETKISLCRVYCQYSCAFTDRHAVFIDESGSKGCISLNEPVIWVQKDTADGIKTVTYQMNLQCTAVDPDSSYSDTKTYVHLYTIMTDRSGGDAWSGFKYATPTVYVYCKNDLVDIINLPRNGSGKIWDILVINEGVYQPINQRIEKEIYYR